MFTHGLEKTAYLAKRTYRSADVGSLDPTKPDEAWTTKIDGAHATIDLDKGKPPKLYSHRISKRTGGKIEYTEKLPHISGMSPITATVRGEVYAVDKKGVAVPPDTVTSILNSGVERSLKLQKQMGLTTRTALIDVDTIDGKPAAGLSFGEKRKYLELIAKKNSSFTVPDIAYTEAEKEHLLKTVLSGKHPETKEGLILHNISKPGAAFTKAPFRPAHDVYVRRIFPEEGATGRTPMAGGFEYAWTPGGAPIGRVGTGFDHATKVDMLENPEDYLGRVAKVEAHRVSANKVLMKPSFAGWHVDKNLDRPKMAKQSIIINKSLAKDRQSAKESAKMYADRLYTARETGQSFRFRQLPPDRFVPGTFRTSKPAAGVSVVYGQLKEAQMGFTQGFMKTAKDLDAEDRKELPVKDYALPGAKKGKENEGKYPVPDKKHARNALARVSQFGSAKEKAEVRAKVHAKFPDIGKDKKDKDCE
jgi:hypothetical protein